MQDSVKTIAPGARAGPIVSVQRAIDAISGIIVGRPRAINLALTCLLAEGHLLIEDVPGVGKTTLAHTLARVLGLDFSRIQFTSDLLPADIIGVSIYDNASQHFRFHPGPLFASVILADEINRATPKAQSALLEAMEERQITAEGETYPLPTPFFVIATQNPRHQTGTFPLPESQLDRFLMRIDIGYPSPRAERELLSGRDRRELLGDLKPALEPAVLLELQRTCRRIHCSDALLDYVQALLTATRGANWLRQGLSPRAGIGLMRAARAWAFMQKRDLVLPEDIQAVAPSVLGHRLQSEDEQQGAVLVTRLIQSVPIP